MLPVRVPLPSHPKKATKTPAQRTGVDKHRTFVLQSDCLDHDAAPLGGGKPIRWGSLFSWHQDTTKIDIDQLTARKGVLMSKRKHEDTTVSLHPLTFDEAMKKLAQAKRTGSEAEESGSTTEPDHESALSTEQSAPNPEARDG